MSQAIDESGRTPKLLARGIVKARIALASGLVLVVGAWLAPPAAQTPLSAPQERAAPLLDEQVQLRDTGPTIHDVRQVAEAASEHIVAIVPPVSPAVPGGTDFAESTRVSRPAAGFGVFVSDQYVVTHIGALDRRAAADVSIGSAAPIAARVVAFEPRTGLVLLHASRSEGRALPPLAADAPVAGELAVAVGRSAERQLVVPVFVTSVGGDEYTLGASGDAVEPGMPVFNLAGRLIAIAAPDGLARKAIPIRLAAERMLARAAAGEHRSAFGLGFQTPSGRLRETFGSEGVIISQVLPGGPGDSAGVEVGDVLIAVGGVAVDSADAAAHALGTAAIGRPVTLRVRRGTRLSDLPAIPAMSYEVAALAWSGDGVPVAPEARVLFAASVLEQSAIPPYARVISVDGRALTTRADVKRVLRQARRAVPVLLQAADRQFFAVVERAR